MIIRLLKTFWEFLHFYWAHVIDTVSILLKLINISVQQANGYYNLLFCSLDLALCCLWLQCVIRQCAMLQEMKAPHSWVGWIPSQHYRLALLSKLLQLSINPKVFWSSTCNCLSRSSVPHWDGARVYYCIKHSFCSFTHLHNDTVSKLSLMKVHIISSYVKNWISEYLCLLKTLSLTATTLAPDIRLTNAAGSPKGLANFMCLQIEFPITRAFSGNTQQTH